MDDLEVPPFQGASKMGYEVSQPVSKLILVYVSFVKVWSFVATGGKIPL